ncbi:molybdopterin-dependent oxidoreductase [Salinactinospora qingdaonensis]|uniref:molybdopterin-dependent oxidoreductase n=1 Tax=Salinactinospora qingdaonensis TaxID=702744 RepID=UPI003CD0679E
MTGVTISDEGPHRSARAHHRPLGWLTGLLAAGTAVGVGELAGALAGTAGPIVVVGDAVVDVSPAPLKEFAISAFGVYDKVVLLGGILTTVAALAAVLGGFALAWPMVGYAGLGLFGGVGVLAAVARRTDEPLAVVPVLAGVAAGALALYLLLRQARPKAAGPASGQLSGGPPDRGEAAKPAGEQTAGASSPASPAQQPAPSGPSPGGPSAAAGPHRRGFLLTGVGVLAVAAGSGALGRHLSSGANVAASRAALRLPAAAEPLPALPGGVSLDVPGLPPFITPNRDFYRIDTALTLPRVSPRQWRLRVHGLVDRPLDLSYEDLLARPLIESDTTLTCVSNQIGGDLVGNTRWLGVRLADLLREAGVHADADQILSTSSDGWTCGTPTAVVMDGREALLAVAMAGEPLPIAHGFPVRMVVPGLYGFVSATKWVTDIKLTRFADERAYWARRGWAVRAPIKTMSRIDVPGPLENVPAGPTTVAGVAWAQRRGVAAVEVRVDGGEWREAVLADVPGIDTWRQWRWEFDAAPGRHTLEVRATDSTGHTQPEQRVEPIPDGATGWHSVQITAA